MSKSTMIAFAVTTALLVALFGLTFGSNPVWSADGGQKLTIIVDVYSGRPNPTFDVTDPGIINNLRNDLNNLNAVPVTDADRIKFERLGYRGILISNTGGIEGIPRFVQLLDGLVKVFDATDAPAAFFEDSAGLENYFVQLSRDNGLTWP